MAKHIDAEMLIKAGKKAAENTNDYSAKIAMETMEKLINLMPAADVVEVKHGYWIKFVDECDCEYIECSCCGNDFYDGDNDTYDILPKYCCECGAKMDGERKQ